MFGSHFFLTLFFFFITYVLISLILLGGQLGII